MISLSIWLLGLPSGAGTASAGQIDFETYIKLEPGMLESELLVRAGPPDLVTMPGGFSEVRRLHYIPGPGEHDPFLTVITIRAGRIADVQRVKQFSRAPARSTAKGPRSQRRSDDEIKVKRAEDTLKAAKAYAETRARLKQAAERQFNDEKASAPEDSAGATYEAVQPDGNTYYGDRPLRHDADPTGSE